MARLAPLAVVVALAGLAPLPFSRAEDPKPAGLAELRMASIMVGYSASNKSPLLSTAAAPASRMAVTVWSGTPAVSPTTTVDGL